MQQNSKYRLYRKKEETVNHIKSRYSKLAQKEYKTQHNWMGKVIHWKLCKKQKFDHTTKWHMHKPEYVLENETHKVLWDFEIQMDPKILAKRPQQEIINKKIREFAVLWILLRIFGPYKISEKAVGYEGQCYSICSWCT